MCALKRHVSARTALLYPPLLKRGSTLREVAEYADIAHRRRKTSQRPSKANAKKGDALAHVPSATKEVGSSNQEPHRRSERSFELFDDFAVLKRCHAADEDIGRNAGDMLIQNGEILKGGFLDDCKEACETYFRLWGGETDYRFNENTGTYEYIDEEVM